jgi:hypothetical protein
MQEDTKDSQEKTGPRTMTEISPKTEPLWTAEKAAEVLCCSVQHVLRLAILGEIPAIDLSAPGAKQHMWRFRAEAVGRWLAEKERSKVA